VTSHTKGCQRLLGTGVRLIEIRREVGDAKLGGRRETDKPMAVNRVKKRAGKSSMPRRSYKGTSLRFNFRSEGMESA
jgi:hypothetical protein